jgi:hypothetical protein
MKQQPVPAREWTWTSPQGTYGVHTHSGMLTWWFKPAENSVHANEALRGQSFTHFLHKGPALDNAPAEIVEEIRALLTPFITEG